MKKNTIAALAAVLLCACLSFGVAAVNPADSGFYLIASPAQYSNQCTVLADSEQSGYNCVSRLSVMCVQNGVGYVGAVSSQSGPVLLPQTFPIYSPPSTTPTGSITVEALGPQARIGLNGEVYAWFRRGAFTGNAGCGTQSPVKPLTPAEQYCLRYGCPW